MSALELKVYELLKKRFSEDEATTVIEYFEEKADRKFVEKKDVLATKEDIASLRSEMKDQKSDILKWVFAFFMTLALMTAGLYLKK